MFAALLHVLSTQQNLPAAHSFVDALVAHLQGAPVTVVSEVVQAVTTRTSRRGYTYI